MTNFGWLLFRGMSYILFYGRYERYSMLENGIENEDRSKNSLQQLTQNFDPNICKILVFIMIRFNAELADFGTRVRQNAGNKEKSFIICWFRIQKISQVAAAIQGVLKVGGDRDFS